MLFKEKGIRAHSYLFIIGIIALSLFLIYIFLFEHKTDINDNTLWFDNFKKHGLRADQISHITHDDSTWYYKGISTCVGYGDWNDKCQKHENYCAGNDTFGNATQQVSALIMAIKNGGVHPECPLLSFSI